MNKFKVLGVLVLAAVVGCQGETPTVPGKAQPPRVASTWTFN